MEHEVIGKLAPDHLLEEGFRPRGALRHCLCPSVPHALRADLSPGEIFRQTGCAIHGGQIAQILIAGDAVFDKFIQPVLRRLFPDPAMSRQHRRAPAHGSGQFPCVQLVGVWPLLWRGDCPGCRQETRHVTAPHRAPERGIDPVHPPRLGFHRPGFKQEISTVGMRCNTLGF